MADPIQWMSTSEAADYLGVTLRTVYRFIDEGQLAAYKFGRVIRVKEQDVVAFVESARIKPGTLEHLHPEPIVPKNPQMSTPTRPIPAKPPSANIN